MNDLETGHKVVVYALNLLAWGTAVAVAWSCSTLLMGIVMFIIMSVVMSLLCSLIGLVIVFKLDASTFETLGRTVNGVSARVTKIFTRKAEAA